MEDLRFGILGCGVIGRHHASILGDLPGARLTAVCDCLPERAAEFGAAYDIRSYTDSEMMAQDQALDVVCVCTPSGFHGQHAIALMRQGKHVVVEKPMDINLAVIDRMLAVQRETGRKLAVIFQNRWEPSVIKLKQAIDEGVLGRLVMGNSYTHWYRSQSYYDSGDWRGTRALDGGGALMNQSVHYVDLLLWLMGPLASIRAHTATLTHRIEVEDTASASIRFRNGALGVIQGTTSACPGVGRRLEVYGDRGSAVIEDERLKFFRPVGEGEEIGDHGVPVERGEPCGTPANPAGPYGMGHRAQLLEIVDAIREGRDPAVGGDEGRQAVEAVLGIYESARTGREVILT